MKIKTKLILLLAIPLIGFIAVSIKAINTNYAEVQLLEKLNKGIELSVKLSSLVHETQKERGFTAGFIGSNGTKFKDNLASQQETTNIKIDGLKLFLKLNDFEKIDKSIHLDLMSLINDISNIKEIRSQVKHHDIALGKALSYYTSMNSKMLITVAHIIKISESSDISNKLVSYKNFLLSKERAGIERAIGTNTLAQDKFTLKLKIKFIKLISAQDSFMSNFLLSATPQIKNYYKKTLNGNSITEVNRIRDILFTQDKNFGIESEYFFSMMTKKINKLKEIDDYLALDIQKTITKKLEEIKKDMYSFLILNFIAFIITVVVAFLILKDIFKKLADLNNGIESLLTTKDTSSRIDIKSNDEIAIISKNFNSYLQSIDDGIKEDNIFIDLANETIENVKRGFYTNKILGHTSNDSLEIFKNSVNDMIESTRAHFEDLTKLLDEYSKYDYRNELNLKGVDKDGVFGLLTADINKLREAITGMLVDNKSNGLTLERSSNVLRDNVNVLNVNSTQSAAALEETAASLEEITTNITNNTNNIVKMAGIANILRKSSYDGQELANQTTSAMNDIDDKVNAINEAISVIDQISFQTNILSLNAAVEAATAGEAGKGFAVVAQEVRNLASRSADAANEIKTLVEDATQKADSGKSIARKMIEGYSGLNENISNTLDLIKDIEGASKEQLQGIEQINTAVNSLDSQTQITARIASETNGIAIETDTIAKLVVSNADSKKFVGKNEIVAKSQEEVHFIERRKSGDNSQYRGVEKRQNRN